MSWTILGVEFGGAIPMIWYPQPYQRAVAVRLSETMANIPAGAFAELAHEVIHLLAPTGGSHATNFEEGLATVFSEDQCALLAIPPALTIPSYDSAARAVRRLMSLAPTGVMAMRATKPSFQTWTPADLAMQFPGAAAADIDFLCQPFARA